MTIRKGVVEDLPQVLGLVRELAEYEKAPAEVTVTLDDMLRDGFGESPVFQFFVAEQDSLIIGIALYYIKYSTWKGKCIFLEDLIVNEPYRKSGIGRKLFNAVVKAAREMNAKRMEWQVLEWNQPAIDFYKKLDASFDTEWINCKLTEEQMRGAVGNVQ